MKIQELAIIFVIIILPISLVLSEYTQFQIKTLNLQTLYDNKLTTATYDAIKAFQLNSINSTTSDLANSKKRDLEASINAFRNSIKTAFALSGYSETELNNYIPALVYTLYDGFYIYSPYENINYKEDNGEKLYGLKPYIQYSCRYQTTGVDVIITYSLDNYITVVGTIDGKYYNKGGYLIDGITVSETTDQVFYNGVEITEEHLKENLGEKIYSYAKINGTKYYLIENSTNDDESQIVYILNGILRKQYKKSENPTKYEEYKNLIQHNNLAKRYYKDALEFTTWFKSTNLAKLKYSDAIDEVIDDQGKTDLTKIWPSVDDTIFNFNSGTDTNKNIENKTSSFNSHRLSIIRHKIETNLTIAISNYNEFSGVTNVFQMPSLKENEWDNITNNISLISFLQGLPIGGKLYNGYSLVTNSESKEVIIEEYIYILGADGKYHGIGDKYLEDETAINAGVYGETNSAGRLNFDFKRNSLNDTIQTYYFYPLKQYDASYNSIVMQDNVTAYKDIYQYISNQNNNLKQAFYTALGRERYGQYK